MATTDPIEMWQEILATKDAENERLRASFEGLSRMSKDAVAALEAEIERLREALKPFADMAFELSARNWKDDRVVVALDNRNDPHRIVAKDFFDAQKAINQQITSDNEKAT